MVEVKREASTELRELIEDSIEYWCREWASNGDLYSGETAWKIVSALATAEEAQFAGLVD